MSSQRPRSHAKAFSLAHMLNAHVLEVASKIGHAVAFRLLFANCLLAVYAIAVSSPSSPALAFALFVSASLGLTFYTIEVGSLNILRPLFNQRVVIQNEL